MDFKSLCDQIDQSRKPIKFYLVKRGDKKLTVIQGLDDPNYQLIKEIIKENMLVMDF